MKSSVRFSMMLLFFLSFALFSEESQVSSVSMSSWCKKSMPCQHDVEVVYEDGVIENSSMSSVKIYELYWDFLTSSQQEHLLMEPAIYRRYRSHTKNPL